MLQQLRCRFGDFSPFFVVPRFQGSLVDISVQLSIRLVNRGTYEPPPPRVYKYDDDDVLRNAMSGGEERER